MITNKQLKIVIDSANLYKENLLNKNVVFIYQNMKTGEYSFIESLFLAEHFLHLTGLEINKTKIKNASTFFALTTANKLNTNHVNAKSDGTTDLKLSILPSIMNIAHTAKMIGNYSNTGTTLYTEKVVGNIHACLGLKKSSNSTYYYPNTVLKKDIRNITNKPQCRIIAIFQKNRKDNKYNQICYLLKDKDIKQIIENTQLNNKISVLSNDQ